MLLDQQVFSTKHYMANMYSPQYLVNWWYSPQKITWQTCIHHNTSTKHHMANMYSTQHNTWPTGIQSNKIISHQEFPTTHYLAQIPAENLLKCYIMPSVTLSRLQPEPLPQPHLPHGQLDAGTGPRQPVRQVATCSRRGKRYWKIKVKTIHLSCGCDKCPSSALCRC